MLPTLIHQIKPYAYVLIELLLPGYLTPTWQGNGELQDPRKQKQATEAAKVFGHISQG